LCSITTYSRQGAHRYTRHLLMPLTGLRSWPMRVSLRGVHSTSQALRCRRRWSPSRLARGDRDPVATRPPAAPRSWSPTVRRGPTSSRTSATPSSACSPSLEYTGPVPRLGACCHTSCIRRRRRLDSLNCEVCCEHAARAPCATAAGVSPDLQLDRRPVTGQAPDELSGEQADQPRGSGGTFMAHKSEKRLFSRVTVDTRNCRETASTRPGGGHENCPLTVMRTARHDSSPSPLPAVAAPPAVRLAELKRLPPPGWTP
jgi:hypothetical protein